MRDNEYLPEGEAFETTSLEKRMLVCDIETCPQDDAALLEAYGPPPAYRPFDESTVKYGNTKDEDKRAAKLAQAKLAYEEAETTRCDIVSHLDKAREKAALKASLGRVYSIGFKCGLPEEMEFDLYDTDDPEGLTDDGEREILRQGFSRITTHFSRNSEKAHLVGWNFEGFDLKFLFRRALILRVDWPLPLGFPLYQTPGVTDLMKLWGGDAHSYYSLDEVAKLLGVAPKAPLFGKLPHELMKEDPEAARKYAIQDLDTTQQVGLVLARAYPKILG